MTDSSPRSGALSGRLLYITNHFTHPVREAQQASPRHQLAKALGSKGVRLTVFSPLGSVSGRPLNDFVRNLKPRMQTEQGISYLFPPLLKAPGGFMTALALVTSTIFISAFIWLSRTKLAAQYSTTVLVGSVGSVLRGFFGVPLIANYGDPDYARESGLSQLAFRFCERVVIASHRAHTIVCADEVIGDYVKAKFNFSNVRFLPPGGYERAQNPEPTEATVVLRRALSNASARTVVYAGQLSPPPYRVDLLVPVAQKVCRSQADVKFLIIGGGSELPSIKRAANQAGLSRNFIFLGPRPLSETRAYVAASDIGVQLVDDICMGAKVVLYMSCRKPVVSAGGSYMDYRYFLKDGENCLLVPPEAGAVADAIIRLLSDGELRTSIGERGWETLEPYSWPSQADLLTTWLAEAVTQSGLPREVGPLGSSPLFKGKKDGPASPGQRRE